jgi:Putative amidase domain
MREFKTGPMAWWAGGEHETAPEVGKVNHWWTTEGFRSQMIETDRAQDMGTFYPASEWHIGDVIIYDWDGAGGEPASHAAVVTKVEGDEPCLAQHTADRIDIPWRRKSAVKSFLVSFESTKRNIQIHQHGPGTSLGHDIRGRISPTASGSRVQSRYAFPPSSMLRVKSKGGSTVCSLHDDGGHVRHLATLCCCLCGVALMLGCGSGGGETKPPSGSTGPSTHTLSEASVKRLLATLPYRFSFIEVEVPKGDSGAILANVSSRRERGRARVGIAFSHRGAAVPVGPAPPNATGGDFEYRGGSFSIRADITSKGPVVFEIEEKLCRWTTGRGCGV